MPSKAIIRSSRVVADFRDAARFGFKAPPGTEVDFSAVMERMRLLRGAISHHDSAQRFLDLGVDVFLAETRFSGPRTVEAAGQTLNFSKAASWFGLRAPGGRYPISLVSAVFGTNRTTLWRWIKRLTSKGLPVPGDYVFGLPAGLYGLWPG